MSKIIEGTVKTKKGDPNANSFIIEGDDGKEYFAHLGDIKKNEDLLYNSDDRITLEEKDRVKFQPFEDSYVRAIHIEKIEK